MRGVRGIESGSGLAAGGAPGGRPGSLRLVEDMGVERWRGQVEEAWHAARTGRHARAVRMCRAAASALARRGAWRQALTALHLLVRLHLQRGDVASAVKACHEADACAARGGDAEGQVANQVWRAWALVDAGERERAAEISAEACTTWQEGWRGRVARAVRLCAVNGAGGEVTALHQQDETPWTGQPADDEWPLAVRAWAARVEGLVKSGRLFDAGREASALGAAAAGCADGEVVAEAALAHLRVAAATGQAAAIPGAAAVVLRLAAEAHLPSVRLRALAVWRDFAIASGDARAVVLRMRVRRLAARAPRGWRQACGLERPALNGECPAERGDAGRAVRCGGEGRAVPGLIGETPVMHQLRDDVRRAARTSFPVLIEGETGSGKELVARGLHALSSRRAAPFRDVNCAALADELVDAELFGHARGAFTGAVACRAGLIEEASGGTLFLDEVADLAPRAQAKLLRALQQQEVRRVGEGRTRPVDVRIVAACNRPLDGEVAAGRFRADLVFRVAGIRIAVPPLRERAADIPLLVAAFWREMAAQAGTTAVLSDEVVERLMRHPWPGNVRELQHVLAALAVRAPATGRVTVAALPPGLCTRAGHAVEPLAAARCRFERAYVGAALEQAGHSQARAARALGLSRQGLRKLLARTSEAGSS